MAYIDKERIQSHLRLKCLAKYPDTFINGLLAAANEIGEMPTADVVEVVRCKDCIHKFDIEGRCMCNINAEEAFGKWFGLRATYSENYCGFGERRTDNE